MSHAAYREFARQRRAEKMRVYNARSRALAKKAARPDARDVHLAAFGMLAEHAGKKRDDMMFHLVGRLTERGFDESESWRVVERIVCGTTNVDTSMQSA